MRYIYVIELDPAVLKLNRFVDANPRYQTGMPLAYVGLTSRKPEQRFEQHKKGFKCSRLVKVYGVKLLEYQCEVVDSPSYADALTRESSKADELRNKGWGVWSN